MIIVTRPGVTDAALGPALARGDEPALHAFFAPGRAWSRAP